MKFELKEKELQQSESHNESLRSLTKTAGDKIKIV